MYGNLSAFFAENAGKAERIKKVVSRRFVGEDGKPVEWEIRPLTGREIETLVRRHTRLVAVPGTRGQYQQEVDETACGAQMMAECTVFPNLHDKALQDSYGVMGAEELLQTMLLAGEYCQYQRLVQELNQLASFEEQVDDAKN